MTKLKKFTVLKKKQSIAGMRRFQSVCKGGEIRTNLLMKVRASVILGSPIA